MLTSNWWKNPERENNIHISLPLYFCGAFYKPFIAGVVDMKILTSGVFERIILSPPKNVKRLKFNIVRQERDCNLIAFFRDYRHQHFPTTSRFPRAVTSERMSQMVADLLRDKLATRTVPRNTYLLNWVNQRVGRENPTPGAMPALRAACLKKERKVLRHRRQMTRRQING